MENVNQKLPLSNTFNEVCLFMFQGHLYVRVGNLLFGCLAVFHLAYLGLMFDSSADETTVGF